MGRVFTCESPSATFVLLHEQTKKAFLSIRHKTCRPKKKRLLRIVHVTSFFSSRRTRHPTRTHSARKRPGRLGLPARPLPAFSASGPRAQGEITSSRIPPTQPGSYLNPEIQVADLRIRGRISVHDTAVTWLSSRSRQVSLLESA